MKGRQVSFEEKGEVQCKLFNYPLLCIAFKFSVNKCFNGV